MPSNYKSNILLNGDLDDVSNSASILPYVTAAGQVDPRAVLTGEFLKLRSDIAKLTSKQVDNLKLRYVIRDKVIYVGDMPIGLKKFSKESMLCDVVFRSKSSMRKNWSPDEVVEKWLTNDPNERSYPQRRASDAADRINANFKMLGLQPLFMPPNGQNIAVNPIYL